MTTQINTRLYTVKEIVSTLTIEEIMVYINNLVKLQNILAIELDEKQFVTVNKNVNTFIDAANYLINRQ